MERFKQLVDLAPDAIVVVKRDGTIDYVNRETTNLFGYTAEELLGRSHEVLIPERLRASHRRATERFVERPYDRPMRHAVQAFGLTKDGREVPIEVSLAVVGTPEGPLVATTIRDITQRMKLEEEALRHAGQLERAQRDAEAASAAKTSFLSSMTHELRTPFNAIVGFAQLLYRDKKEPLSDRQRQRVDQILRGAEHLLHLIDDVLDLSHIESGSLSVSTEAVEIRDVLDGVLEALQPAAEDAGVLLSRGDVPDDGTVIAADRTRFTQILMNYGANAIKYNRRGGAVTFSVSVEAGSRVRVSVADTGVGIPEDKQAKLFQPFQRAGQESGPIEGTGIGLAISKRLAELMRGGVGFRSAAGDGSVFWVDLPADPARGARISPRSLRSVAPSERAASTRRSLLYVEDNPANVALMRDLLSAREDVDLLTAPTGEMGIELARHRRPRVIVLDINLPGMSGLEALAELQRLPETKAIPVIALTAAATEHDRQVGKDAGFFRYLTKPIKLDELEAAIEAALAPSREGDPSSS